MPDPTCEVLCVGILVADVFAPPLARLPLAGELLPVDEVLLQTGGCAANTGANLARLGVRVGVIGRVGHDVFADFIRQDLASKGVDVSGIVASPSTPTSRTVILTVVGEDRRYIHAVGANADLSAADIDRERVKGARVLYVGGYPLFPGLDQRSLAQLLEFARQQGIRTVLDVAGVRAEQGLEPFRQLLPFTDVFLPNDDEARLITGESDPLRQAEILLGCGVSTAVITLGSRGSVACTPDLRLVAGAFQVNVVDPSGGGDAFAAGFIVGMLDGWDLCRSLEFASAIGASACTKLGCTAGVFDWEEATAFLAQNPITVECESHERLRRDASDDAGGVADCLAYIRAGKQ
jgi:sugar/nucleoside kinase (ribokinase family)